MNSSTVLEWLTLREIFQNSPFRSVQFESIFKYCESWIARAFKRLLVYTMNEISTNELAIINKFVLQFISQYHKKSLNLYKYISDWKLRCYKLRISFCLLFDELHRTFSQPRNKIIYEGRHIINHNLYGRFYMTLAKLNSSRKHCH